MDQYLLRKNGQKCIEKMGFSKRRVTSTSNVAPSDLDKLMKNYLIDIYSVMKMENIPNSLIVYWD